MYVTILQKHDIFILNNNNNNNNYNKYMLITNTNYEYINNVSKLLRMKYF